MNFVKLFLFAIFTTVFFVELNAQSELMLKNSDIEGYNIEDSIDCLSVSSNVSLKKVASKLRDRFCLQGNLDPFLLVQGGDEMVKETIKILNEMQNKFFIFNLGHGVLPQTPIENVYKLIDTVRSFNSQV